MNHTDSLNSMKRAEHIQAELNELGAKMLMNMPSTMPYTLPTHYFEGLGDEVIMMAKINDLSEPKPDWGTKMPFEAPPAAYFDGLSAQILAKVDAEPEWSKAIPFTVPQGYFENLPETILAKAKENTADKKPRKTVPLFRTAQLAASMALIIFAGFGVMNMNKTAGSKQGIAAISNAEIQSYIDANLDDFDTDIIINGLASNDAQAVGTGFDISDEEIRDYLNENGWN